MLTAENGADLTPQPVSFLEALQVQTARTAITSSSMRGPGCGTAICVTRAFTGSIELRQFSSRTRRGFDQALDDATAELLEAMPRTLRWWGLARKGLNIFLRECLYSYYLRDTAHLGRVEEYLELPLDSYTGNALRKAERALPRWDSVRRLTPELSQRFQAAASDEARRRHLARVHLDVFWWGHRGEVDA